ncbi:hypothetical protein HMPREF0620_0603 [Parascardovia denticolens DSM 10105 = JCM 12538]|uniref:Uncharacterized protein n=1 Tax=Parascardovia denticolens DSM 10105 = JCM 12538 TaxID=864564 RepID=E6K1B7_PARDN|nr:hypothetical protein HMPREF0620_0603 [Parascardovia denticolens DSM 10105 = JCM 12538]
MNIKHGYTIAGNTDGGRPRRTSGNAGEKEGTSASTAALCAKS